MKQSINHSDIQNDIDNDNEDVTQTTTTTTTTTRSLLPTTKQYTINYIDPTYFETPVQQLTNISGGTAPFYRILLTESGRIHTTSTKPTTTETTKIEHDEELDKKQLYKSITYYIGKDLSHAIDEYDFYEQLLHIKVHQLETSNYGIGILLPFFFDYLGVIKVPTFCTNNTPGHHHSGTGALLPSISDAGTSSNSSCNTDPITNITESMQSATISKTSSFETTSTDTIKELLVLQNLRNEYSNFRMIDIKIGQQTSQGGWHGKSHIASMKQSVIDKMSNSTNDGYRLEGFDNYPPVVESMNPLLDVLRTSSCTTTMNIDTTGTTTGTSTSSMKNSLLSSSTSLSSSASASASASNVTIWGKRVSDRELKKARRMMLQTFTGSEIIRLLIDVHHDQQQQQQQQQQSQSCNGSDENTTDSQVSQDHKEENEQQYTSVEIAEIILHELVIRLVQLAIRCHEIKIPQKWIGSSVALGYDAGLYPSTNNRDIGEQSIRSKVITNIFDWGRSELLTEEQYTTMTNTDQNDRQKFWNNYKNAIDRLSYYTVCEYYNHFTTNNQQQWKEVCIQVMDYDSLGVDDYLGTVSIPFPDNSSSTSSSTEGTTDTLCSYPLHNGRRGILKRNCGTLYCSIKWISNSADSRLVGSWQIHISHATNLPARDITNTSDPYCIITAYSHDDVTDKTDATSSKRTFQQSTCIIPRTINPVWNEFFDVPVVDSTSNYLTDALEEEGVVLTQLSSSSSDQSKNNELGRIFQYASTTSFFSQNNNINKTNDIDQKLVTDWTSYLQKATTRSCV